MKILTTTTKPNYPSRGQQTQLLPGWAEEAQRVWQTKRPASLLTDIRWALRLFFAAKNFDAVITGFERPVWIFALLRRITFLHRPAHVFLDAHPALPGSAFSRRVRKWLFRQIFLSEDCVVAFSKKQRDLRSSLFHLPESRFAVIPYWATVAADPGGEPVLGEYVFAGGDEERDYPTLIEACP